jgi:hypothetical protein
MTRSSPLQVKAHCEDQCGSSSRPEAATAVRFSEGRILTTDGPFTGTKEQLGGFYIIEADDLDGFCLGIEGHPK